MISAEIKMICSELKGIRKGLERIAKEICMARTVKDCEMIILEENNGNPSEIKLCGKRYKLKPEEDPPQAGDWENF